MKGNRLSSSFTKAFLVQIDVSRCWTWGCASSGRAWRRKACFIPEQKTFAREKKVFHSGERGSGYKVGCWYIKVLSAEASVCLADRPKQHQNQIGTPAIQFTIHHCLVKKKLIADYFSHLPDVCKLEREDLWNVRKHHHQLPPWLFVLFILQCSCNGGVFVLWWNAPCCLFPLMLRMAA